MNTIKFRIYPDETVLHEDDFGIRDSKSPFQDDYILVEIPEILLDYLEENYKTNPN